MRATDLAGVDHRPRMEEKLTVLLVEAAAEKTGAGRGGAAHDVLVTASIGGAADHDQRHARREAGASPHHGQGIVLGLESTHAQVVAAGLQSEAIEQGR